MTPTEILALARTNDIVLDVQGERLVVDAPIGALTAELRSELARNKAALVALLTPDNEFVTLRGGLTVPLLAVLLALDLERRGFRLSLDADEQLMIAPMTALTTVDLSTISRWRLHVAAIVGYDAAENRQIQ